MAKQDIINRTRTNADQTANSWISGKRKWFNRETRNSRHTEVYIQDNIQNFQAMMKYPSLLRGNYDDNIHHAEELSKLIHDQLQPKPKLITTEKKEEISNEKLMWNYFLSEG